MNQFESNPRQFPKAFPNLDAEIEYFQKPEHYIFVPENNQYIQAAKTAAKYSLTSVFPIGIVAVKNNEIIAQAGNGNGYHESNENTPGHRKGCIRRFLNDEREKQGLSKFKGGEGFELCPGCHTDSHAEANLIKNMLDPEKLKGADIYMYGHFWCCKPCWNKMLNVGIKNVYLPDTAMKFNNKDEVAEWAEEVRLAKQ